MPSRFATTAEKNAGELINQQLMVSRSRHCTTTLVGEDTDLLILLLHYSSTDNENTYFRSDANKQSKER